MTDKERGGAPTHDMRRYHNAAAAHHTGLLVPPLDPGALAAALGRLADDAPLRRLLGAAGRRRATLYTPERVATAFLRTVMEEGLLSAGPGATVDDLHRTGAA